MLARQSRPSTFDAPGINPGRIHPDQVDLASVCGFSRKPTTRPIVMSRMMPSPETASGGTGLAAIVTSAPESPMGLEHVREIHPIELIAREDQHVVAVRLIT